MDLKYCPKCKRTLPKAFFNKKRKGLQYCCRDCNKACLKKHYKENTQHYIFKTKKRKSDTRAWINSYKSKLKCARCGENTFACLDFHHTNPETKEVSIARVWKMGWSTKRIEKEIEKCIVLCANCHRKEHYKLRCDIK